MAIVPKSLLSKKYYETASKEIGFVGETRSAFLDEVQMQTVAGSGWVLCDGRDVTGSVYSTLTGNSTIPDVRGVSLRAKNNGRVDGNENPDGELPIGSFQDQATAKNNLGTNNPSVTTSPQNASHSHVGGFNGINGTARYGTVSGGSFGNQNNQTVANNTFFPLTSTQDTNHGHTLTTNVTITGGANETRMKNVTCNVFIKIN